MPAVPPPAMPNSAIRTRWARLPLPGIALLAFRVILSVL
jgi:hypothetical protein